MMVRKPTRRGIRHRATRHRSGGTVYQNEAALDRVADDALAERPARVGTPEHARQRATVQQRRPSPAEVVQELVDLLDRSGWQRLEVCRSPGAAQVGSTAQVSGYCVDGQGDHVHVADLL